MKVSSEYILLHISNNSNYIWCEKQLSTLHTIHIWNSKANIIDMSSNHHVRIYWALKWVISWIILYISNEESKRLHSGSYNMRWDQWMCEYSKKAVAVIVSLSEGQ